MEEEIKKIIKIIQDYNKFTLERIKELKQMIDAKQEIINLLKCKIEQVELENIGLKNEKRKKL